MANEAVWNTIHGERAALADDLAALTADQWDTASLCSDWTVRDVVAHMTGTAKLTPIGFVGGILKAGFNIAKMQANDVAEERGTSAADTLARFRSVQRSTKSPPGPTLSWLGEALIHAEDIRRPLGIAHDYPTEALVQVADFYKGSNLIIGAKKRIAGLRLEATDAEWSTGDGPVVRGPVLALVMAMTGRKATLSDLTGDGVTALADRP